jgi:hypothetical protein
VASLAEACGQTPLVISSAAGIGVEDALHRVMDVISSSKEAEQAPEAAGTWQP